MTTTIVSINKLSAERTKLYGLTSNGRSKDPAMRQRIGEMGRELELLWEQRRQERAGRREGIDLLIEHEYAALYGTGFEEAAVPLLVAATEDEPAVVAA